VEQIVVRVTAFPGWHKTGMKSWMVIKEAIKPVYKYVNMAMQLTVYN
jgi:hypothetical protein